MNNVEMMKSSFYFWMCIYVGLDMIFILAIKWALNTTFTNNFYTIFKKYVMRYNIWKLNKYINLNLKKKKKESVGQDKKKRK